MSPITSEQIEKRRQELTVDLQQTEQQVQLWSQKILLLRGALLEIEGWTKGDLAKRNSPDSETKEPAAPEAT